MRVFILALFVATACASPALHQKDGETLGAVPIGVVQPAIIPEPVELPEPVLPEVATPDVEISEIKPEPVVVAPDVEISEIKPEPVVVAPDAEILEIKPEPVVVAPDVEISEIKPEPVIVAPDAEILEIIPEPVHVVDVQAPNGEIFNDGLVQVTVNTPETTGIFSTLQSWFSLVLNYVSGGVQTTQQIV